MAAPAPVRDPGFRHLNDDNGPSRKRGQSGRRTSGGKDDRQVGWPCTRFPAGQGHGRVKEGTHPPPSWRAAFKSPALMAYSVALFGAPRLAAGSKFLVHGGGGRDPVVRGLHAEVAD